LKRPEFVLVLAILAVAAGLAGAQAPPQAPPLDAVAPGEADLLAAGLAVFERARFGLWTAEMDVSVGRDLLDRSEGLFVSLGDAAARDYLLARVELYRGRIEVSVGDERVARGYFETAMDLAEASLDRRESAEAYRVLADAG